MYRFNGELLQQTYTIYCMQAISTIFGVILSFFNNIISKTLITLHILCTCSSMGLQVAFRFSRIATSATCWTLAIAARSCKLILKFSDEIGVATKYRSWFETGSHIMNCQSPIKITMRRCSPFSVILQCVELQSYIWSNKQAINLAKLAAFIQDELIHTEAERYVHQIIKRRHQQDWKNIWRLSYFHAFTSRLGRGSVSAQLDNGFQYMKYSKGLYYDGHDQPDHILDYHQKLFFGCNAAILIMDGRIQNWRG